MVKSRALLLKGLNEPFELVTVDVGEPLENEVLVKMTASGICHSDLSVQSGVIPIDLSKPVILGHEGAGIVAKLGPGVTGLEVGDAVLLSFDFCGKCGPCSKDTPVGCKQWFPLNFANKRSDGTATMATSDAHPSVSGKFFGQSSFSEYSTVSVNSCVKVDSQANLTLLSPLGCGIQTGAGAVLNTLKPKAGQSIAIWGLGGVGMAALSAAKSLGCNPIIGVDLLPSRLELAKELGATHAINGKDDVAKVLADITGGEGVDFVVEATGAVPCIKAGFDALGLYGTMAQIGAPPHGTLPPIDLTMMSVLQKRYVGILEGDSNPPVFIKQLMEMVSKGDLPLEKISKVFKLEDFEEALAAMKDGSVIKPILSFE